MKIDPAKRIYRQGARAAAAEATGRRILDVFTARLSDRWFDEITLEEVAREAGVTVQTVIRRFGGKEGLLEAAHERFGEEIRQRRNVAPGDVAQAIDAIIEDYEQVGDLIVRVLAQEERYAPLRAVCEIGRKVHRQWVGEVFATWLGRLGAADREAAHDALVVATDLYLWKLVRRDMRRPKAALRALMATMIAAALGCSQEALVNRHRSEARHASR